MSKILETVLPKAEIIIIKRDFEMLSKIALNLPPSLQTQLVPYTAMFCHEVLEYFAKMGQSIAIEETSRYSIKDIRQKAKFFDLRLNKLLQSVRNVDTLQNDSFAKSMKFPELHKWNIHDNIGIWFDKNNNVVGNTHYSFYVFQDEKMIGKPADMMNGHELQSEDLYNFSYDMGRIIGTINDAFSDFSDFIKGDFSIDNLSISSQDYNTNRCNTFDNDEYKIIRLFLLHVLSGIGFIIYALKNCIIRDTGILLRLEYITYHYAIKRLKSIKNYIHTKQSMFNDENLITTLDSIDHNDVQELHKSDFRNYMMHFSLKSKDEISLIDESNLDLSKPFCGLVESQFNGMNYIAYQQNIENELDKIAQQLKNYLNL